MNTPHQDVAMRSPHLLLRSLGGALVIALVVMASGCRSPAERAAAPIIEKNAAARGGLEAWRKVQALSMAGSLEAGVPRDPLKQAQATLRSRKENVAEARREKLHPAEESAKQVQLPFVMELRRPRATRMEIVFQGKTAVQVYDGSKGWKVRPFLGRREIEPYTEEELKLAAQQEELDGPLIDYAAKGNKVELVGTERFEGREAYKLKVTTAAGVVRTVLVDAETSLEVRVDGERRMDGKVRQVWTALRDYKPVEGLLIPHTLETTVEGVPGWEKILVEHVSVNPEVADARFSKPE